MGAMRDDDSVAPVVARVEFAWPVVGNAVFDQGNRASASRHHRQAVADIVAQLFPLAGVRLALGRAALEVQSVAPQALVRVPAVMSL